MWRSTLPERKKRNKIKASTTILLCGTLIVLHSRCVNLKEVQVFSNSAGKALQRVDELDYDFEQFCQNRCLNSAIDSVVIVRKVKCPCREHQRADSIFKAISVTLKEYFGGLAKLSQNKIARVDLTKVEKDLKFSALLSFSKEELDSYTRLAKMLIDLSTDSYRKHKLAEYVREGNPSVQVLAVKLEFLVKDALGGLLESEEEGLYDRTQILKRNRTLDEFELRAVAADYYQRLQDLELKRKKTTLLASSLKRIGAGHQEMMNNLDHFSDDQIRKGIIAVATEINALIKDYDALHK